MIDYSILMEKDPEIYDAVMAELKKVKNLLMLRSENVLKKQMK
jgi:hypothetical protein